MPICKLHSPEDRYSGIRQKELQRYLLLAKPALSHNRHEYVTREVEHVYRWYRKKLSFVFAQFQSV